MAERAGLGSDRPGEINEDDDEFDQYRKRMMMAYRFRPNPLVSGLQKFYRFGSRGQSFISGLKEINLSR